MMHKLSKNDIQKLFCGNKFDKQFFSLFSKTPLKASKHLKRPLSCARHFKCITALLVVFAGGFTQNANESLNAVVWSIAPKAIFSG